MHYLSKKYSKNNPNILTVKNKLKRRKDRAKYLEWRQNAEKDKR